MPVGKREALVLQSLTPQQTKLLTESKKSPVYIFKAPLGAHPVYLFFLRQLLFKHDHPDQKEVDTNEGKETQGMILTNPYPTLMNHGHDHAQQGFTR